MESRDDEEIDASRRKRVRADVCVVSCATTSGYRVARALSRMRAESSMCVIERVQAQECACSIVSGIERALGRMRAGSSVCGVKRAPGLTCAGLRMCVFERVHVRVCAGSIVRGVEPVGGQACAWSIVCGAKCVWDRAYARLIVIGIDRMRR